MWSIWLGWIRQIQFNTVSYTLDELQRNVPEENYSIILDECANIS